MPLNPHESFPYQRIVVIGVTGCGKSYLAEKLARKLDLGFIELDALYWKPGWVDSDDEEFRQKVEAAARRGGGLAGLSLPPDLRAPMEAHPDTLVDAGTALGHQL
jgi:ABC-type iron transport system FetAB ATPase subunit